MEPPVATFFHLCHFHSFDPHPPPLLSLCSPCRMPFKSPLFPVALNFPWKTASAALCKKLFVGATSYCELDWKTTVLPEIEGKLLILDKIDVWNSAVVGQRNV